MEATQGSWAIEILPWSHHASLPNMMVEVVMKLIDRSWQNVRYAVRRLGSHRVFGLVTILTLGLAIGATTAVCSFFDRILNQPPSGTTQPEDLVAIYLSSTVSLDYRLLRLADLNDIAKAQSVLSEMAAFFDSECVLTLDTSVQQVPMQVVSRNFFSTVGVKLVAGRGI